MTMMKVEFRAGSTSEATRARVTAGMKTALASLPIEPTSARVTFTDENGPKGGEAIRCALEVRLPRRPAVHVADVANTPRLAFDAALAKLERTLRRLRETARESKRRPKKYFAARRALAGG
jgi:ribosome-associated translation inhibitor RaiA